MSLPITKIGAIIILIIIGLYVGVANEWIHFEGFFQAAPFTVEANKLHMR